MTLRDPLFSISHKLSIVMLGCWLGSMVSGILVRQDALFMPPHSQEEEDLVYYEHP